MCYECLGHWCVYRQQQREEQIPHVSTIDVPTNVDLKRDEARRSLLPIMRSAMANPATRRTPLHIMRYMSADTCSVDASWNLHSRITRGADSDSRAVSGVGLRPLACWDCGFESRQRHRCLSLVSVVCCQVEVPTTGGVLLLVRVTECYHVPQYYFTPTMGR